MTEIVLYIIMATAEIQQKFNLSDCKELVLHWDGKLLSALTAIEKLIVPAAILKQKLY